MVSLAGNEPNDGDAISISKTSEDVHTEQVHHTRGKQSTPSGSTSTAEISKKQLLQLAKTDMTAQAVNLKYNELNKFLLAKVKRAEQKVTTSTCSNVMLLLLQGIF